MVFSGRQLIQQSTEVQETTTQLLPREPSGRAELSGCSPPPKCCPGAAGGRRSAGEGSCRDTPQDLDKKFSEEKKTDAAREEVLLTEIQVIQVFTNAQNIVKFDILKDLPVVSITSA